MTLEIKDKTNFTLKLLSWIVLFFSILCSYSVFTPHTHLWLMVSDAVTVQFIYDDLLTGPGKLKDWYFPAAPSVFPDLFFYSLAQIFHQKFTISIVIYALMQMTLISFLGSYIFEKTASPRLKSYSWLVPCIFSIIFMEAYYFNKDILMNQLLTSCYYHAGPFVNCLIVYAVFLSNWSNVLKAVFFFLFCIIAAFSDLLYVVMLTGPFILSLLLTLNRVNAKRNIFFVISIAVGTLLGLKIYDYLKEHGTPFFYNPEKMYEFSSIMPSLRMYVEQMMTYIMAPGFRSFHILFTFLSIPVAAILWLFKRKSFSKEMNFFLIFLVLFSCAVISAPIINGNYIGYDTWRYNVASFYFSIITLVFFIAYLIEFGINKPKIKSAVSILFVLFMLLLITIKFSPGGLKNYSNYYPEKVKTIDSICDKYQLKHGISIQEHSKVITLFSKKNLEVLAANSDACLLEIGSNINWYYVHDFDFVITDRLNMDFAKTFKIKDTIETQYFTILKVENFYYPKGTYAPITR